MFDSTYGARRLREVRAALGTPRPALWSYPVLRERCSCGALTEAVATSREKAEEHFSRWRAEHVCPARPAQETGDAR